MDAAIADPELKKIIAETVAEALQKAGFVRRAKLRPPPIGLSFREAADASSVCRSSLYAAIRRGELIAYKRGAKMVIMADDLERWLRALPAAPTPDKSEPPRPTAKRRHKLKTSEALGDGRSQIG